MTMAVAAVKRGERAALFIFDEELGLLFGRSKGMGIDLEALRDNGHLFIEQMDAAEVSPGEFAHKVRSCVETEAIRTVIIDSLNGYQNAMPEEQFLILHMHELLQYLNRLGAARWRHADRKPRGRRDFGEDLFAAGQAKRRYLAVGVDWRA
jgi:circadian clock protein KaiC